MSKLRISVLATLAVVSFGISGISAVSAAPANGSTIDAIAPAQALDQVYYRYYGHRHYYGYGHYYGYRHYGYRHCWWSYGRRICRW
jgi:hypothetical protein